jgi:hypothetical protein
MTRQTFGQWALASATAFLMLGCGQPADQFIIIQNQVPGAGCAVPTTLSAEYRATGILDVALVPNDATVGYAVFPVLQNNLPGPSGGQSGDPNRIRLMSYEIDVAVADDAPEAIKSMFSTFTTSGPNGAPDQLIHYGGLTSGSVASGGGNTSSGVTGVPGDLARYIRGTGILQNGGAPFHLLPRIRFVGATTNRTVTSDPFDFPILVCSGCLISNAVEGKVPICPTLSTPNTGNPCNVAQDNSVDCCTGNGGQLVCPATVVSQ